MVIEGTDPAIRAEPIAIHVNAYESARDFDSRWRYQDCRVNPLIRPRCAENMTKG